MYTSGYRSNTVLKNSIISGNSAERGGGIYAMRDSTFNNCTIYGNFSYASGGGMYLSGGVGDTASISNCIVWGNRDIAVNEEMGNQIYANTGGVSGSMTIKTYYCSIQNGPNDLKIPYESIMVGNWISEEPNFANPGHWETNDTPYRYNDDYWIEGDYHLKSQAGRWDPSIQSWIQDDVTSPCIDAGNPNSPIGLEPFPNGGYLNMGAYGGTDQASKSYFGEPVCETIVAGDINGDCRVDILDMEIMIFHWLEDNNP